MVTITAAYCVRFTSSTLPEKFVERSNQLSSPFRSSRISSLAAADLY